MRLISPCQESSGKNSQTMPSAEQAQDQIVILGPSHVSIAERLERGRSNGQGGVGDGAFHKSVLGNGLGGGKAVQPVFVEASALTKFLVPGEDADPCPDRGVVGLGVEPIALELEPLTVHPVIGIHASHQGSLALLESAHQGGHQSSWRRVDHLDAIVQLGCTFEQFAARV